MKTEITDENPKTQQAELPYTEKDRLKLLDLAVEKLPESLLRDDRGRFRRNLQRNLSLLVIKIQGSSGQDGCFARVSVLAAKCRTSEAWVRRHVTVLEQLGWVTVTRDRWAGGNREGAGGQTSNQYVINWTTIRSAAMAKHRQMSLFSANQKPQDEPPSTEQKPRLHHDRAPSHDARAPCHDDRAPSHNDSAYNKDIGKALDKASDKTPPPSGEVAFADYVTTEAGSDWLVVVQKLMALEVVASKDACETAWKLGATPENVFQVISHYETHRGAWGPGALKERVEKCCPAVNPGALWPPAKPAHAKKQLQKKIAAEAEQAKRDAAQKRAQDAQVEQATQSANIDREAQYGAILDAMTEAEMLALVDRMGNFQRTWVLKQKRKNWKRHCRMYFFDIIEADQAAEPAGEGS